MSTKDVEKNIGLAQFATTGAETAADETEMIGTAAAALGVVSERTIGTVRETRTMSVDANDSVASPTVRVVGGGLVMSPGGGKATEHNSDGSDKNNSKRKTRRGKTKRGKRSTSSRPYSKSQWKFHVPLLRTTAANKRRVKLTRLTAGSSRMISITDPFMLSDQPPLVPYNTNRFLMEDHMPHVLTPSEDEEEFLTKEFSSVYEDARSERLEGLSKSQLIQEYLQLEANYEQVTRRYNAAKSLPIKEENESAVNIATATTMTTTTAKDATEGGAVVASLAAPPVAAIDRRRLEERIRELTTENLELRRQLEHASRIGMVLSAKSSPRNYGGPVVGAAAGERMDSSSCHGTSSEDSESDSSSSTSSSSSDNDNDDSASSMSDDENDVVRRGAARDSDREPLVVAMDGADEVGIPMESNGYHDLQNGDLLADDEDGLSDEEGMANGPVSPRSGQSINSPPPPPLVTN
ncbi:uncharacterized protein LOC134219848 isoform X2 [Armigeres subalbatus]|uniref:uncharacterized protein LOC134219848 isoform X2 n=1 Tax=Armigeres subalbatus TaxID=124917 RepID=UPI002ED0F39D